ncbi:hypothetical protein F5Y12DRAFT_775453 [Xylaria sp. FL1777]|nr:hypothetical protein F5Y12DRAFT_775453 [Xylaria sp. FL1777]
MPHSLSVTLCSNRSVLPTVKMSQYSGPKKEKGEAILPPSSPLVLNGDSCSTNTVIPTETPKAGEIAGKPKESMVLKKDDDTVRTNGAPQEPADSSEPAQAHKSIKSEDPRKPPKLTESHEDSKYEQSGELDRPARSSTLAKPIEPAKLKVPDEPTKLARSKELDKPEVKHDTARNEKKSTTQPHHVKISPLSILPKIESQVPTQSSIMVDQATSPSSLSPAPINQRSVDVEETQISPLKRPLLDTHSLSDSRPLISAKQHLANSKQVPSSTIQGPPSQREELVSKSQQHEKYSLGLPEKSGNPLNLSVEPDSHTRTSASPPIRTPSLPPRYDTTGPTSSIPVTTIPVTTTGSQPHELDNQPPETDSQSQTSPSEPPTRSRIRRWWGKLSGNASMLSALAAGASFIISFVSLVLTGYNLHYMARTDEYQADMRQIAKQQASFQEWTLYKAFWDYCNQPNNTAAMSRPCMDFVNGQPLAAPPISNPNHEIHPLQKRAARDDYTPTGHPMITYLISLSLHGVLLYGVVLISARAMERIERQLRRKRAAGDDVPIQLSMIIYLLGLMVFGVLVKGAVFISAWLLENIEPWIQGRAEILDLEVQWTTRFALTAIIIGIEAFRAQYISNWF